MYLNELYHVWCSFMNCKSWESGIFIENYIKLDNELGEFNRNPDTSGGSEG